MKTIITPFKVGLVILAGMVAFAYMFGRIGASIISGGEGYTVYVHLDDSTGLAVQSHIKMAGISVGVIEDIELDEQQALVTIRMRDDIDIYEGIPEEQLDGTIVYLDGGAIAQRQASLMGDVYLELTSGLRGDLLQDGDEIPTVIQPVGAADLMERMAVIGANLEEISNDVQEVTSTFATVFGGDEGVQRVDRIVTEVEMLVTSLENIATQNEESLGRIVDNIEQISDDVADFSDGAGHSLDGILADVSAMTAEMRFIIGQSSGDVEEGLGTMRSSLASLQLALDNLNYSLENVQEITDHIADGEGTIGALVNDSAISDETEALLVNANQLFEQVTGMETWVQLRSEYATGGHSLKNYLTLTLRPNEEKYYLFEIVDDPRGRTETIRTTVLQNDPTEAPTSYEERTITTETVKISITYGGRWQINDEIWLGARWGFIESSGGIGGNIWAFDENLEIRADLFDFGINENARFRTSSILDLGMFAPETSLFSFMFVQAGIDDVFNPVPRDFFLGGGVSFNDHDLRGMLMLAPSTSF